jgi:hypothetical protein
MFDLSELTYGADPEFELVGSDGKVLNAYNCLAFSRPYSTRIGLDGAGSVVEFRPKPAKSPQELINNFRLLLVRWSKIYPQYGLSALGIRYPIGGHLHLGARWGSKLWHYLRSIDFQEAFWASIKWEEVEGIARIGSGYESRAKSIRTQPHGIEVRFPPAAAFASPENMRRLLKVAQMVIKMQRPYEEKLQFAFNPLREFRVSSVPAAIYIDAGIDPRLAPIIEEHFDWFIMLKKKRLGLFKEQLGWVAETTRMVSVGIGDYCTLDTVPELLEALSEILKRA